MVWPTGLVHRYRRVSPLNTPSKEQGPLDGLGLLLGANVDDGREALHAEVLVGAGVLEQLADDLLAEAVVGYRVRGWMV